MENTPFSFGYASDNFAIVRLYGKDLLVSRYKMAVLERFAFFAN